MILFHRIGWKVNRDTDRSALDKRLSMPISWNYKPVLRSQLEVFNVLKAMLMTIVLCLVSEAGWVEAQPLEKTGLDPVAKTSPRYKIGVIDTGYNPSEAVPDVKLCKTGHYDYSTETENLAWTRSHGTRVVNVIAEKLTGVDYCLVIYQAYKGEVDTSPLIIAKALVKATTEGVTAVNISSAGSNPAEEERAALEAAAAAGVVVFTISGNNNTVLNKDRCTVYPACYGPYKNVIVVGGQKEDNPKEPNVKYGHGSRVDVYAPTWYRDKSGVVDQGTSYAAPRALAEYILFLEHKRLGK